MSDPLKFKNDIVVEGDISLPAETSERVLVIDNTNDITSSTVTITELELLSGATVDLVDLEDDVADLVTLSGVAANAVDLGTFTGAIIPDNSDIKEALQSLETEIEAIPNPIFYAGTYDANTNSPDLDDVAARVQGALYRVTVAGTHDFGAFGGSITFVIGDKAVYNGTAWEKWDVNDEVLSVNTQTGVVVLEADDIEVATGYTAGAGVIAAGDTIQEALEKLDGNIDDHITDTTGAHAASAISVTPAGNLAADDVQEALTELQDEIDDLVTLSGVASGSTDLGTFTGSIIPDNSDIKESLQALETEIENLPLGSTGDIPETSFALVNDQSTAANVTGLSFAVGVVRSFSALVSVEIDGTSDLFEQFTLQGINKGSSFNMSVSGVGDNSGVTFSITSGGQVQYTSGNVPGFVSGSIKFRAITTSV